MSTYRIVEIVEQAIPDDMADRRLLDLQDEKGLTGDRAALIWAEEESGPSETMLALRELRAIRESLDAIQQCLRR